MQSIGGASGIGNAVATVTHNIHHSVTLQHSHTPEDRYQKETETYVHKKSVCEDKWSEVTEIIQKCTRWRMSKHKW